MLENARAAKMQSQKTALFTTIADRLTARRVTISDAATMPDHPLAAPLKTPVAGRKRRWRQPLRMTPKAQRRRWFKEHARRMRARALTKMERR